MQRTRLVNVKCKAKRVKYLACTRVNRSTLALAACTPALAYGWDVMGASDTMLKAGRATVASMIASGAGGKNPDAILMLADAAGGSIDPAHDAHSLVAKHWAQAWWERWQPTAVLERSFREAVARLRTAARSVWDLLTGPVSALVASLWRRH